MMTKEQLRQLIDIADTAEQSIGETANLGWKIVYQRLADAARDLVIRHKKFPDQLVESKSKPLLK